MKPDEITELRRLAEAATPGPWEREHGIIWGAGGREKVVYSGALTHDVATLEFIAASREAIPKLLDELDALHALAKEVVAEMWDSFIATEVLGWDTTARKLISRAKDAGIVA